MLLNFELAGSATVGQRIAGVSVGRYGMTGLDGVVSVTPQPDGTVLVVFANGTTAIVNLSTRTVQTDAPGNPSPEAIAALYEALALDPSAPPELVAALENYHADRTDLASLAIAASAGEKVLAGADAFYVLVDGDEPTEESARLDAVRRSMEETGQVPLWLRRQAEGLPPRVSPIGALLYGSRAAVVREAMAFNIDDWDAPDMRKALTTLAETYEMPEFAAKVEKAKTKEDLDALSTEFDELGLRGTPAPITLAARNRTARQLGLKIYTENPRFVFTAGIQDACALINDLTFTGTRAFGFAGPPGTGKNTFINELAAAKGMPVFEVDFSAGDSIRDLLGDIALEDGNTRLKLGTLTRALSAKGGVVAVYNEIVSAKDEEMTALHNILGSGADQSVNRFITFKAPEGIDTGEGGESVRVEIDPDSLQFLTWNPGRADERPPPAVARRMATFSIEYGSEDEEVERLCNVTYGTVERLLEGVDDPAVRARWDFDPDMTKPGPDGQPVLVPMREQCPDLERECRIAAKMATHMRRQFQEDDLQHYMDTTTLARFLTSVLCNDHFPSEGAAEAGATVSGAKLGMRLLDFMYDQTLPAEDRYDALVQTMAPYYGDRIEALGTGSIGR
ncbi:AAA family ATPase [Miltoncostaea oceani]|uniref:AAA family ATPase n=1 Tax=Miltoncostaea oceani TaxID=2843216 RepID=UPI001C3D783C|nr:AAA family ATPase [Miltoncostaea oceani]